jgi:hypothetical protein
MQTTEKSRQVDTAFFTEVHLVATKLVSVVLTNTSWFGG